MIDPLDTADPWRAERGEDPVPVAEALAALTGAKGWGVRLEEARVHERWARIAGDALARHAEPVRLHGGVLVVRADSPAWAAQVRGLAGELAARADAVLGAGQVQRVTVTTGALRSAPPGDRPGG